jgi:hypothetical protein
MSAAQIRDDLVQDILEPLARTAIVMPRGPAMRGIEMLCGLRIKSTLGLLLDVPADEPRHTKQWFLELAATWQKSCGVTIGPRA